MTRPEVQLEIPAAYEFLLRPSRYKCTYGGRGSAKSWSIARALIALAYTKQLRILCVREFQSSIQDSVLRLLADQIEALGLTPWFAVQKTSIVCTLTGSEFLFKGLRHNIQEIKSTEGVDIAWCEEAQSITAESWQVLVPTIRKTDSEIWISFNPDQETDATYRRFVVAPPPDAAVRYTTYLDNPRFPAVLEAERQYMLATDPDAYEWVWGGHCRQVSDAIVFRGKVDVETFEPPEGARFYFGADWGFSQDPTVLVRCYVHNDCLWVDHEAYAVGVELDDVPTLFDTVPGARDWPILADNSQPQTISYIRRKGFQIHGADKWSGSVEDGVTRLKSFRRIKVHERCRHTAEEMRLYSYKTAGKQKELILPQLVDRHNHTIDALRYGLEDFIQDKGSAALFAALAD